MSYQVLSLKWRPQSFADMHGQDHVTHTLINAFKKDRVAQAYIFTGPRGVGKTTTARLLAKSLNCPKSKDGVSCNECNPCNEITDGRNMDVLKVDGASNRGIEEIRNLREVIKYAPVNAPYKVFIIDEVHMLTTPAFNALLRTLEEPPPHGKFILCTTDIQKVPSTIISRCQRFDFHRISVSVVQERLAEILKSEKVKVDKEALKEIARKADGSMRDALSILDQVIAYGGDVISMDEVAKVLGLIPHETYFKFTEFVRKKNSEKLIALLREIRTTGTPLEDVASGLTAHVRNLLYASVDKGLDALELNEDVKQSYTDEIQHWDNRDLLRIGNILSDFSKEIKKAEHPQILLEMTALKLLEFDSTESIQDLIKNGPKTGGGPVTYPKKEGKPAASKKNKAAPSVSDENPKEPNQEKESDSEENGTKGNGAANGLNLEAVQSQWGQFLSALTSKRPSLGSILEHSTPENIQGGKLTISVPELSNFAVNSLKKNREEIEAIIESAVGKTLRISYNTNGSSPIAEKPKDVETPENGEPVFNRVMERFDGEILR